jgi:hypothetical protein
MIDVRVGDIVTRDLAGCIMDFKVSEVQDGVIHCGSWTFDQESGAEIDEDLGWGPKTGRTGSFIKAKEEPRV